MSGVTTATVIAGIGAAGALASAGVSIAGAMSGGPKLPTPAGVPVAPISQAANVPTASSVLAGTTGAPAAGPGGSNASTLLTGGQGVDPAKLFLGKSNLLGS